MGEKFYKKEEVQAYVDGELDHNTAEQVKELIQTDPVTRSQFIKLVRQKQLLKLWWKNAVN